MQNWPLVEADFLRVFHVHDPLVLSWRKFKVLIATLPSDSLLKAKWQVETDPKYQYEQTLSWREQLAEATGRKAAPIRNVISLDQFIGRD